MAACARNVMDRKENCSDIEKVKSVALSDEFDIVGEEQ